MRQMTDAWKVCDARFAQVSNYIAVTGEASRQASPQIRAELYGSWVLMAYGACQYSFVQLGKAAMRVLARRTKGPFDLPKVPQKEHYKLSLEEMLRASAKVELSVTSAALANASSSKWAETSPLLNVDRNVWPDFVREWLGRLEIGSSALLWMDQPPPGRTETPSSRMAALVRERNPIAHGELVSQVLDATLMAEWLADCRQFAERCGITLIEHLSANYYARLPMLGQIDRKTVLGNSTVAFSAVRHDIEVGDHVVLRLRESTRGARVESLMSSGQSLDLVRAGAQRVSVTLSRPHKGHGLYLCP